MVVEVVLEVAEIECSDSPAVIVLSPDYGVRSIGHKRLFYAAGWNIGEAQPAAELFMPE